SRERTVPLPLLGGADVHDHGAICERAGEIAWLDARRDPRPRPGEHAVDLGSGRQRGAVAGTAGDATRRVVATPWAGSAAATPMAQSCSPTRMYFATCSVSIRNASWPNGD